LNSLVNDRRRRAFLRPIVSIMMDILSGVKPLIVDVRQTRSSPSAPNLWACAGVVRRRAPFRRSRAEMSLVTA
jgi:hypothetical protein